MKKNSARRAKRVSNCVEEGLWNQIDDGDFSTVDSRHAPRQHCPPLLVGPPQCSRRAAARGQVSSPHSSSAPRRRSRSNCDRSRRSEAWMVYASDDCNCICCGLRFD
jgi:hypothetical protein